MKAILGRKVGMTQVFATDGTTIPKLIKKSVELLPKKSFLLIFNCLIRKNENTYYIVIFICAMPYLAVS